MAIFINMDIKQYWEDILAKDQENWVIYEIYWIEYWNKTKSNDYKIKLITHENKGFIILLEYKYYENYIFFAYVAKQFRKQGVLKELMKKLKKDYKELTLNSIDKYTDIVWEKVGFKLVKERKNINHCSKYKYSNK